jgi:hypothetical protein
MARLRILIWRYLPQINAVPLCLSERSVGPAIGAPLVQQNGEALFTGVAPEDGFGMVRSKGARQQKGGQALSGNG